ncbi:hypothetical protein C4588_05765 [Candidatus Parcubacteria bacterium]|nr:MAG: hypothetical protein C4588_05765 [Candidatus Parcubacteria bacterium]
MLDKTEIIGKILSEGYDDIQKILTEKQVDEKIADDICFRLAYMNQDVINVLRMKETSSSQKEEII